MANDLLGLNLVGPPDEGPSPEDRALVAGFAGAVASLVVAAALWWGFGAPLLPLRVADAIFAVMPIWVVEAGVSFLGPWAKRLAFAGCVGGYAVILGYAARALVARRPKPTLAAGLAFGAGVWLAASLTVLPLAGGGLFGLRWGPNATFAAGALLASALAYGAAFAAALARLERDEALARRGSDVVSRRTFFGSIVAAGVTVALVEGFNTVAEFFGWGNGAKVSGGTGVFPDLDGLSREVTPVADFYHVSKNVFDPDVAVSGWRLEVGGLVASARSYTLAELRALPAVEAYATLACISNFVGGDLISNGLWRGVPLAAILADAGVGEGAIDLKLTAADDYTDSIPIERAVAPGTLLAYDLNGAPLDSTHGAPLRLVVPGIFGMKNVKWITRLDVVAVDFKGYWQSRGWDDRAPYQTMSRVDVASAPAAGEPGAIAGIAFAGDRGISRVEVSTDAGATWADADLRPPLSENAWTLWNAPWIPALPGAYTVIVRATDGTGAVQTRQTAPPIPRGSTGWHSVSVTIKSRA